MQSIELLPDEIQKALLSSGTMKLIAWCVVFVAKLEKGVVWVYIAGATRDFDMSDHYCKGGKTVFPIQITVQGLERCCIKNGWNLRVKKCFSTPFWGAMVKRRGYILKEAGGPWEYLSFNNTSGMNSMNPKRCARKVAVVPFSSTPGMPFSLSGGLSGGR